MDCTLACVGVSTYRLLKSHAWVKDRLPSVVTDKRYTVRQKQKAKHPSTASSCSFMLKMAILLVDGGNHAHPLVVHCAATPSTSPTTATRNAIMHHARPSQIDRFVADRSLFTENVKRREIIVYLGRG
jgi:hypothetical protein